MIDTKTFDIASVGYSPIALLYCVPRVAHGLIEFSPKKFSGMLFVTEHCHMIDCRI